MIRLLLLLLVFPLVAGAETSLDDVHYFLANDNTDTHEYLPWYTCGHYARTLTYNASLENITIGGILLGYHPRLRGKWNSHAMNYVIINGSIVLIEPQTDKIMPLESIGYRYYRLYPNGVYVPTYWTQNLATVEI